MSQDALQQFMEAMKADKQLSEGLGQAMGEAVVAYARQRGFALNIEDLTPTASAKIAQSDVPDTMLALLAALKTSQHPN